MGDFIIRHRVTHILTRNRIWANPKIKVNLSSRAEVKSVVVSAVGENRLLSLG